MGLRGNFWKDDPMSGMHHARGDESMLGGGAHLLYNLVYCSRASPGVDDAEVDRIIASARRHNPSADITGLLVFGSGIFFQWLEGPRQGVRELMAMISADRRHDTVVTLSESEEVRDRLFPNWDMELVGTDDIRDVLVDALGTSTDAKSTEALTRLLDQLEAGPLSSLGQP